MKIAIIIKYENINKYENLKFRNTCKQNGIALSILDRTKFQVVMDKEVQVHYDSKPLIDFDYIIPRTGSATSSKDAYVYDAIKTAGFNILNDGTTIKMLMDKLKVHTILTDHKIPTIKSMMLREYDDLTLVDKVFDYPIILKSNTGSLGWGIYKVDSHENLVDMLNISVMSSAKSYFFIQEFVQDDIGNDYRVFMYKDKVIAQMRRYAPEGEFITNFTKHNLSDTFELPKDAYDLCLNVMNALGCELAGIDLLIRDGQFIVCEVNSAPGFQGLEHANPGLNVVKSLIKEFKAEMK